MKKKFLSEFIYVTFGTLLLAVGIGVFYEPDNIVTGGFSGLAIILSQVLGTFITVPVWLLNLILNIPLLIASIKFNGPYFLVKTLYATCLLSLFLFIVTFAPQARMDLILSAIYGGVFSGIGLGFVFRGFASTGGTDLLAIIINKFVKHISVSKMIFYLDSVVVAAGLLIFGYEKAMYAIVSIYISSKCIEAVLEGLNFSKAAFIISDYAEAISSEIIKQLDRGVTSLSGQGMYTNNRKTVLLTVVSVKQIVNLKEIVSKIDKNSFVIVADVREVLGEGFIPFG
ncbi:MAG: YitT family protein [Clostridiales bacterium]|jgi:uncharacterized membrane-anchored protein YitT (DUF2179 family)|nr:YitT family protein [Clostridiales bacterium]